MMMGDDSVHIQECEPILLASKEEKARVLSFASQHTVGAGGVRTAAPPAAAGGVSAHRAETGPAAVTRRPRSKTVPLTRIGNRLSPEDLLEAFINLVSECISSFKLK